MKTRALVIPFHHYEPYYQENYRLIFEYFKLEWEKIWRHEIDTLYFIDSNGFLYNGEEKALPDADKIKIIPTRNYSHAQNLNFVIPMVTEDLVGIMDMDTVVYRKSVLDKVFQSLQGENAQVVSYVERPSSGEISRFAPYFFFTQMEVLKQTSMRFDEAPELGHLDPLAKLTHEILALGKIKNIEEFDDRSTIQMQDDGIINRSFKPYPGLSGTGSYHLRNFNGGIHIIDSFNCDKDSFNRDMPIIPFAEMSRIFGWEWVINEITMKKEKLFEDILTIVKMRGIKQEQWENFIAEFKKFHSWIYI